jgi:hypothetical protein
VGGDPQRQKRGVEEYDPMFFAIQDEYFHSQITCELYNAVTMVTLEESLLVIYVFYLIHPGCFFVCI